MAQQSELDGHELVLEAVERFLDYQFQDRKLLFQSLTHSSYSNEISLGLIDGTGRLDIPDNERFEFLGDAVIGLVVAKTLMDIFPQACEGRLSRWRSNLVSRKTLAEIACELRLGEYLLLGRGEKRTGGAEKRSILAAVFEAVIGALYLDGGIEPVTRFLTRIYDPWVDQILKGDSHQIYKMMDKKTHLQERTQSIYKTTPVYRLIDAWGLEHEKHFRVEILIAGDVIASGDGRSKKEAEQQAASHAIEVLGF